MFVTIDEAGVHQETPAGDDESKSARVQATPARDPGTFAERGPAAPPYTAG